MVYPKKNDEAASEIMGVILMVAVTVILAAVIAAFTFGMAGNITKTRIVAATASHHGGNITVTYHGGPYAAIVSNFSVLFDGADTKTLPATVGNSVVYGSGGTGNQHHVVVIATFTDGDQQVILDTYA